MRSWRKATAAFAATALLSIAPAAAQQGAQALLPDTTGSTQGGPAGTPDVRPGPRGPAGPGLIMGPRESARTCGPQPSRFIDWQIDRIDRVVRPTEAQRAAFNDLKAATIKAEEVVRATCPAEAPLTPPARLDLMEKRLTALLEAVRVVRPTLDAFYKTLDDDQKARFIAVAPQLGPNPGWRERWRARWNRFWQNDDRNVGRPMR